MTVDRGLQRQPIGVSSDFGNLREARNFHQGLRGHLNHPSYAHCLPPSLVQEEPRHRGPVRIG
jgi:hypothetical protein